jgi:hypothetical protein
MTGAFVRRCVAAFAIVLGWTASAAAQAVVVVGTGNPDSDVPAVQAAVDQGGEVSLIGHFSFDRPPTNVCDLCPSQNAMIRVSKAVAISGTQDGEMTTIQGGETPFSVESAGAPVEIRRLRFIRPKGDAINVSAVSGLVVASCKIEGVEPSGSASDGIAVATTFLPPTPDQPGHPENVSGTLSIVDNDIDVAGGTVRHSTQGIVIFSVGVPGAEVEVHVSGNRVRNTTEPAINLRRVSGRAYIERNALTTGSVAGSAPGPHAIRVVNTGSYLIAHNLIDCGWVQAEAGIAVFSRFVQWPMERAIVVDNDVTMSAPEGTVFGDDNAAIKIKGFAGGNVVLNNRIRGRARAGLSVDVFRGGTPANNAFILNRFDGFEASRADVFVGAGVTNTLIVGEGSVEDHGTGTTIVPIPF